MFLIFFVKESFNTYKFNRLFNKILTKLVQIDNKNFTNSIDL
jgi:hypothetical protein